MGRWRIALGFVLGAALVHGALYTWYTAVRPVESRMFETEDQFAAAGSPVDLLILGDSHAKCGIDPSAFDGAFTFAQLGGVAAHSEIILRDIVVKRNLPVRRVILSMDTHAMAWQKKRIWEPVYWTAKLPFPLLAKQTGGYGSAAAHWMRHVAFPYAGTGDALTGRALGLHTPPVREPMTLGWVALPYAWTIADASARQADARQRCAFVHDGYRLFDPDMVAAYERMFALCAERNIEVVLVRFPVPGESADAIRDNVDMAALDERFRAMAPPGTVFLDYFEAFRGRYDYFADADHLNAAGAAALTALLRADLAE